MTIPVDVRLRRVMAETFALPEDAISDEASIDSLKAWDSVSHLTLMLAIEGAFTITLSMEEMSQMTSFAKARAHLQERVR